MPLGSIFYTTHPFMKKTYNCENFGRKSLLLTMETIFFEIQNYAMEWCHHKKMDKEGFLNKHLLKVLKLLVFLLFFLFHYFKYYGPKVFSKTMVFYLIVKVERKEKNSLFKTQNYLVSERKEKQNFSGKISKDIRKMIVLSFMFLFNLSKSFV